MRIVVCDLCDERIEDGEQFYKKPSNTVVGSISVFREHVKPSDELHICTGCFAKVRRVINEVVPQLLNDFVESTA